MNANRDETKEVRINYRLTAIFVAIMIGITIAFLAIFPTLGKNATRQFKAFSDSIFLEYITNTNYVLLNESLGGTKEKNELEKDYLDLSNIAEADKEKVKSKLSANIEEWNEELEQKYRNLEYYAVNTTTGKTVTNNDSLKAALTQDDKNSLSKDYDFYGVIEVNDVGGVNLLYLKGADDTVLQRYFQNSTIMEVRDFFYTYKPITEDEYAYGEGEDYQIDDNGNFVLAVKTDTYSKSFGKAQEAVLKPVTNMKFVYAVKSSPKYYDRITTLVEMEKEQFYESFTTVAILTIMAFMAFITMVVPYKKEREMAASRVILRLPIEVIIGLIIIAIVGVMGVSIVIFPNIHSGDIQRRLATLGIDHWLQQFLINGVQLVGVFLCLTVAVFVMVLIKNMFHIGIFRYIKEKSMIIRGIVKVVRFFTDIDLSDKGSRRLFMLMAAHGIIIFILCCMWGFGAALSILYTLILYIIIRKKYTKLKKDYKTLSEKTEIIANGNLDVTIDEELGFFDPLKEDINNIKNGLKNAVEEEVKSQNLKTELITNVSHDLKTPLTSIITYVDLLKEEGLTEEQRAEYLDILDKKSQRLKVLIEDLFEMSKTTTNNITLHCQNIDLVTLNREVFVEYQEKLEALGLQVKSEYKQEKVVCYLDSQRAYRILENLYGNIIKYAMPNTRVYVTVSEEDGNGTIVIKNISANELNFDGSHLMERFVRGDVSRNTEGSGLGLAIAKGLVEAQGGSMKIEIDGDLFKVIITFPISTVKEENPQSGGEQEDNNDWLKEFYEASEEKQETEEIEEKEESEEQQ